jgi:hypothetical protein
MLASIYTQFGSLVKKRIFVSVRTGDQEGTRIYGMTILSKKKRPRTIQCPLSLRWRWLQPAAPSPLATSQNDDLSAGRGLSMLADVGAGARSQFK